MVRVITVNNFKGGVSKTSTTNGIAYTLSEKMNFKTLVIDIDPQADATDTLLMTFNGNVKNSLIVMQTHRRSFKAVQKFVEYLTIFKDNNQLDFEIAGILPVMFKRNGKVDKSVLEDAKEKYGEYLFNSYIYQRDRVKLWDETGITDDDFHDKRTLKMYYDITNNLLDEINAYESE